MKLEALTSPINQNMHTTQTRVSPFKTLQSFNSVQLIIPSINSSNEDLISHCQHMKSKDLLKPIKSLTKKLNNNYEQVEALITQKRQTTLKKQLERLSTK
jgi:lipopolysaccharide biosynthesis protein